MKFDTLFVAGLLAGALVLFASSCSKQAASDQPVTVKAVTIPKDSVLTPFGMRSKKDVHQVQDGTELTYQGNRLVQINSKTRSMVTDFGEQRPLKIGTTSGSLRRNATPTVPTLGSGWITYAADPNAIAYGSFGTDFTVPANPPTYHNQLVYIFNGLQDGFTATSHILQPVLQFGNNGAWGGNYWTINNWYASCQTCAAYYGTQVTVAPGTVLEGTMAQTERGTGTYSYTSRFSWLENIGGSTRVHYYPTSNQVNVSNVPQMLYAFETLEAYNMQVSTDYPNGSISMNNIYITLDDRNRRPRVYTPSWTAVNSVTDVGQHTVVTSPSQVDIYFH